MKTVSAARPERKTKPLVIPKKVVVDGEHLTVTDVARVARHHAMVDIAKESRKKMAASRALLDRWLAEERVVYGITTGFGPMVSTLVPTKYQTELQQNLIRSHSANVGPLFSIEETRAAMLLRLNAFAKGYSAVRWEIAEQLRNFLNLHIHPCIPQWGSVGASGDLTPSAHVALAIMGEGEVEFRGKIVPTKVALKAAGLSPVTLSAKEGLALINGTTMMTGVASLQVYDAWNLVRSAEVISALSLEVLLASTEPFNKYAQQLKPHPGQLKVAANLSKYLSDSKLVVNDGRLRAMQEDLRARMKQKGDVFDSGVHVQNVYSMRATPQVLGAVRDALDYITARITTEMNSSNDNPLFMPEHDLAYQGAHFHGQPVSLPMDVLSISLTEIGIISERRLNRMLDATRSGGLSPFLARGKSGLKCGFEGAQYIPTSLVAECRTLCNPASIQSIPSNGENQDVVSMGLVAARKARDIKERIEYILAVELLAACEGVEERGANKLSTVGKAVYKRVRGVVPSFAEDRPMTKSFEEMKKFLHAEQVVQVLRQLGVRPE